METTVQTVWTRSKLLIKSVIIGGIVLILQIPTYYVTALIQERESRQKEAITEVSSKWAGRQNIIGPVLVIPYWVTITDTGIVKNRTKHLAYFLPDSLTINANVIPQEKYRGIYKVMLYTAGLKIAGNFSAIQPQKLGITPEDMIWAEAYMQMNTTDNRGLNDEITLKINDSTLLLSPHGMAGAGRDGLKAAFPSLAAQLSQPLNFSASFSINGSEQLLFTPTGRSTTVNLTSGWPHPSFTGNSLPQTTKVNDTGFVATWKSMGFKQSFPQQWKDDAYNLHTYSAAGSISSSAFGADLFVPVSGYQKTMRSVKYSFLCLALTFAAFFLIETTNKKSAHPFHYGLIGLALILFYTLLLSVSEYIGFNPAYVIASACTIGLIGWFAKDVLTSGKLAVLLSTILMLLYGYVFTILQLQDYSLLLGSFGLFITLAVIMRFSKKIQW
ncbi:MAG TPA: cell envelope integrity protein CreD [Flavisolibacter sp.]|nr:cell envelope integrity protein CreD [Flavisolibacter sp.]